MGRKKPELTLSSQLDRMHEAAVARGTITVMASSTTPSVSWDGGNLHQMYSQQYQNYQWMPTAPPSVPVSKQKPKYKVGDIVQTPDSQFRRMEVLDWRPGRFEPIYQLIHREPGNDVIRNDVDESELGELVKSKATATKEKKKATVSFDTVVMADEKRAQILEALEQVHQADLIFDKWGFGETIEKGRGVSMLFYGPPGTGKTLTAQAIANKLESKLKVVATADIESSAPGEAERNIRKYFKEAKEGEKTVLLFDECDSLIYSRENVGVIMAAQVNELLSQIEKFDGVVLFTTNRLGNLDEAFNRRLALKLEFPMPNQAQRAEIWQRMFPKQAPVDKDVDWMALASIELTGGYIKNAVLRAARMAATEKVPNKEKKITQAHLVRALRQEGESMIDFQEARESERGTHGIAYSSAGGGGMVRGRGKVSNG